MRRSTGWIVILMLIMLGARVGAFTIPYEAWMGSYIGGKKVGYLSFKIERAEPDGYRIASVMHNRLTVLGADLTQVVTTAIRTDADYNPLTEDFAMSSGGKTTRINATFKERTVECVISAGTGSSTRSVPIPEGANLVGDALFALVDDELEVGKEYSMHYFNPLTLTVDEQKVIVERKERLTVSGKDYDTVVMRNITPMGEMTVWQVPGGDVVKVHAVMGITMVLQSREEAMSKIESGTQDDFAVLTSVKPDVEIPSPRELSSLKVVLAGLSDPKMAINDARQKVVPVDGKPQNYQFDIRTKTFNSKNALERPINESGFSKFLATTPYLDYNIAAVRKQAEEIVGGEKNTYAACSKIRSWVYANLKRRADIGITRAASDVLESKVGVCRDYAILFAALARGAGIPTTVASGLLYTDGAFYYHAWVECYVGEWVPFDATMATDFVDATHIKLATGDATSMFALAKVMGSLKVVVKSFK